MEKMERDWTQLWLEYRPVKDMGNNVFAQAVSLEGFEEESAVIRNACEELENGFARMLGTTPVRAGQEALNTGIRIVKSKDGLAAEGYRFDVEGDVLMLFAPDERGALYGCFQILRTVAMERVLVSLKGTKEEPSNPLRMLNHWDNMDGSIERGYSGSSFFFRDGEIVVDARTRDYARMAASVGINAVVINNVNVKGEATYLITGKHFGKLAELGHIFAGYGIRLFLSLNFAAVMELSDIGSADPMDERVASWWKEKMAEVFSRIPNLGGFLVKADSEGRPGPFTYGRTQADGANMLADAAAPYGGVIIWRCFVYNCTQDWRDRKTDRAKAGYDNFIGTDGDYRENVILQIKNGPMDFQIREPVSPLLGGMRHTNQMLEVQVAQEYTGQQIDLCYLVPLFKEVLDFKTYCAESKDTVADIVSGRTFGNQYAGIAAVSNTGDDRNWTGNDLAAANLYGFGRLAFRTDLSAREIAEEWVRLALSNDEAVVKTVVDMLCASRGVYEKYTSPLGIGWMVTPNNHYGPSVDGYEYSRWGTYHRADHLGIGVDRTDRGTGYVCQYHEPNASLYNNPETCPEELLLFFHHLPYTWCLRSGKSLIQHIYDSHFEGAQEAEAMARAWDTLEDKIPERAFKTVRERFARQLDNARKWRDQVNSYFYRKSGIPDEKGREIY